VFVVVVLRLFCSVPHLLFVPVRCCCSFITFVVHSHSFPRSIMVLLFYHVLGSTVTFCSFTTVYTCHRSCSLFVICYICRSCSITITTYHRCCSISLLRCCCWVVVDHSTWYVYRFRSAICYRCALIVALCSTVEFTFCLPALQLPLRSAVRSVGVRSLRYDSLRCSCSVVRSVHRCSYRCCYITFPATCVRTVDALRFTTLSVYVSCPSGFYVLVIGPF